VTPNQRLVSLVSSGVQMALAMATQAGGNVAFGGPAPLVVPGIVTPAKPPAASLTVPGVVPNITSSQPFTQLVHGQPFVVTGFSGAGVKSRGVAPIVSDIGAAATGTFDPQWTQGSPDSATNNTTYNLQNRDVGFSPTGATISTPHPYVSRILAGCANADPGPGAIGPKIEFTRPTGDFVIYAEWYYRADPNWSFCRPLFATNGWQPSTTYSVLGTIVFNFNNLYQLVQAGTSASSGSGPIGSGSAIVDGTCQWSGPTLSVDDNLKQPHFSDTSEHTFYYLAYNAESPCWHPNETLLGGNFGDQKYNAPNTYVMKQAGTTAATGGPTGTGTGIVDGTCKWDFQNVGPPPTYGMVVDGILDNPDANGHSLYWNSCGYPMSAAGWTKHAYEYYVTPTSGLAAGGRIDLFENNNLANPKVAYRGTTDISSFIGSIRGFRFGGYQRDYSYGRAFDASKNWRYGADFRFDITAGGRSPGCHVARLFIGDNPNPLACTKLVYQIAGTWVDNQISVPSFWKGDLVGGTTGYAHVQPEAGSIFYTGWSRPISVSP
jgi:hypothetical protein